MNGLPENAPNIWLRSFYGFSPEVDGYIGWTKEAGRDHMLNKIQSGDLIMVYGASSSKTQKNQRLRILGFLQVDAIPIRDVEKASEEGMRRKKENGWGKKWTYGLPIRRAWRAEETVLLQKIAKKTYRPEAGQSIAAWSPGLEPDEVAEALKIKVSEVNVFGEEPIADLTLEKTPLADAFKPSKAFPGTAGKRTSLYEDGETYLYLAKFEGDGHALVGRPKPVGGKSCLMKVGVSNAPKRRCEELNSGFPPAAKGRWNIKLTSQPYENRNAAEVAEQIFKDLGEVKLESLGKEFFWGKWTSAMLLFSAIPGASRWN